MTRHPTLGSVMVLAVFACRSAAPGATPTPTTPQARQHPRSPRRLTQTELGRRARPTQTGCGGGGLDFVARWARPQLNASDWLAALRPRAVPAYAALLATVDPANVPATSHRSRSGRPATPTHAAVDVPHRQRGSAGGLRT